MDQKTGTPEMVMYLNCSERDAFRCFSYVINKQSKEYRKPGNTTPWRVVRLFNKDGQQLAQESWYLFLDLDIIKI